jgi:rod shape-determining protein MreC
MDFLLSRYRNMTALLLVLLAQLVLLAWQVKSTQDVRLIRIWAVTAVTPMARVLEFVREHTIGVAENYFVLVNVRTENVRLKEEIGRVKMENQFLRNELSTAERVKALQAFQQRTPSRTLPARIIGTGTGTNARVVFIDQGSSNGVMRGMAVVTPDGIVGKVLAAYPTASQVLLVTDETFAAGVISQKNRVHGTVKGAAQSKVVVDYVQNEEKVEVGEMFYTSGDDRVFPKGMPVGKVTVVRPGKTFKEIYLVPAGLQQGLEEVLVVIEGVHGQIPDVETAAAPGMYLLPPVEAPKPAAPVTPVAGAAGTAPAVTDTQPERPALMTDADRLRERYKRIGEAQNHPFGEPSRPPNFNLNPDAARPSGATAPPQGAVVPPTGAPTQGTPRPQTTTVAPQTTAPRQQPPATGAPVNATPRPQTTTPAPQTTAPRQQPPATGAPVNGTPRPQTSTPAQGNTTGTGAPQTTAPRQQPPATGTPAPRQQSTAPLNRSSQPVDSVPVPSRTVNPRADETRPIRPQQ